MLRIALEGIEIFHDHEERLSELPFGPEDIDAVYKDGFETLLSLVFRDTLRDDAAERLKNATAAARRIALFHAGEQTDLERNATNAANELPRFMAKFNHLLKRKAYPELLELYPYFAPRAGSLTEWSSPQPERKGVSNIADQREQRRILREFKSSVETGLNSQCGLLVWLGKPPELARLHEAVAEHADKVDKLKTIQNGIHDVTQALDSAVDGTGLRQSRVYQFAERVMRNA